MMRKQEIILRREGEVGFLEINNPPKNYLERPDFIELDKLKEFVCTGIKVLVIFGTGRNFSAGANIESIKDQIKEIINFQEQLIKGNRLLNYIDKLEIPVIAAISGICFGAGFEISLACDIRICDKNAFFAFPEIGYNLFPGLGGIKRLKELTGQSTAMELVLDGDLINAEKALKLKIVDEVVGKKQALNYSVDFAKKITNNRPLKVINAIMKSINNSSIMDIEDVIINDAKMFSALAHESMSKSENE